MKDTRRTPQEAHAEMDTRPCRKKRADVQRSGEKINDDLTALVLCILEVGWKTERYFLEAIDVLVSTYRCSSKDCRKGRSRVNFKYIVINTKYFCTILTIVK